MNVFTLIVVGFLTLIGVAVFFIGIGAVQELRGRSKSRRQGCGPSGWRYLFVNESSLPNRKITEIAKAIMDKGHLVVRNDEMFELEVSEYDAGGLVLVSVVDVEDYEEDDDDDA